MALIQEYEPDGKRPSVYAADYTCGDTTQPNHKAVFVQHIPLFSGISAPVSEEIASAAQEKVFSRRQTIFFQGEPIKQVILLTLGCVKTTQLGMNGTEVIIRLSGSGDLIGATGLVSKGRHRSTARALAPSKALVWDAVVFECLLRRFPILRHNVAGIVDEHLRELEERYLEMSTENVANRVGHEIARLVNRVGERVNGAVKLSLSCEELAQLTGTTLFTVSRALSLWREQGIVSTGRRALIVHDPQALAELSAGE